MRTHLLLGLLCSAMFFNACAQGKKTTKKKTPAKTSTSAPAGKPGRDITAMTMQRTGCFGRCPSYTVELYSDGRAVYTGQMYTTYLGTYEKNVGAAKVQTLLRQAQSNRVDTCADEYQMMVSDLPGLNFSFTRPQGTQEIRNAHFGPPFLKTLGMNVDDLVQVDRTWRKTAEPAKQ